MKPQYKMQVSTKNSQNKLNITAGKVVRVFLMIAGSVAIAQMALRVALSYYMIPVSTEVVTSTPIAVDRRVEKQQEADEFKEVATSTPIATDQISEEQKKVDEFEAEWQMITARHDDALAKIKTEGDRQRRAIAEAELLKEQQEIDELQEQWKIDEFEAEWRMIIARQDDALAKIKMEEDQQRLAIANAELNGASIGSTNRSKELLLEDQLRKKVAVQCQTITEMKLLLEASNVTDEVKFKYGITELENKVLEGCRNSN